MAKPPRNTLLSLHQKHGSWSAAARHLKVPRATLNAWLNKYHLIGKVDHTQALSRLRPEHSWLRDREELRRRLQAHGGMHALAIAEGVRRETVGDYVRRHGIAPEEWTPNPADYGIRRFDQPITLQGDWAVASDFQAPYTSQEMTKILCRMGGAWGIQNLLIAGDFVDLESFSRFDALVEAPTWETTKEYATRLIATLREAFPGKIVWTMGNHELRIARTTKGKWGMAELAAVLGAGDLQIVNAPAVCIDSPIGPWEVVHPGAYSVIPTAVGKDLAIKHQRHMLIPHGHQIGYRRDPSGRLRIYDIGCMADIGTLAYVHLFPSRHPLQRNGFALLRKGHAYVIEPDSDLAFWEAAGAR